MGVLRPPLRPLLACLALAIVGLVFYVSRYHEPALIRVAHSFSPPSLSPESPKEPEKLYGYGYHGHSEPVDVNRVTNTSLGFSKIFVVGLPERTDKRDAIALTSDLTGFQVEWVDGVKGSSVPSKALPFGVDREILKENTLGSWRGHMNAVRRIIDENLESALIMEDDMDWDVRLKAQLEQAAQGVRFLLPSGSSTPSSPYGDDWDVLWLGNCGDTFPELLDENKDSPEDDPVMQRVKRKYVIENDITVPSLEHLTGVMDFSATPHTRWVHTSGWPICTFAYALSRRGARKVLYEMSVDHLSGPFDNSLANMCRNSLGAWVSNDPAEIGPGAKCVSVTPSLFYHHKAKGPVNGDSDIQDITSTEMRWKGTTENIVWSARNNLKNMMQDLPIESQY